MAQVQFSANLLTQQFPYNFYELSNAVEISSRLEKSGREVNQPYFADNVLPITDGFASIGFTEKVPSNAELTNVQESFVLYGPGGRLALFASDNSTAWVYDPQGAEWSSIELPTANFSNITYATIREETYIFLGTGLFHYNFETQTIDPVEVEGIEVAQVQGVTSAGGRLILWDKNRVYYSSPLEPTEFTPGLGTGAGFTGVEDLRGEIIACASLGKDFIIYSKISAVSARATDNPTFPFRFKEVQGSAGVNFARHIAHNTNVGAHIVWTNSGFQQVTVESAQYIWAELSNGIIRGLQIRRDSLFGIPVIERTQSLDVKISFVSNRFLAVSTISGKEESYFDCYILDTSLERWGKLSVPHSGFIEYVLPEVFNVYTYDDLEQDYYTYDDLDGTNIAYRDIGTSFQERPIVEQGTNLGIILPSGSVQAVSFAETGDFRGTDGSEFGALTPTLFLGRYKLVRDSGIITQWIKLRELFDAKLFWYGHTYDGSFAKVDEIVHEDKYQTGHWFGRMSADSVSLELRGNFKLTDLVLCAARAGQLNQLRPSMEVEIVQRSPVFEKPEFDYVTSWLYSPFAADSATSDFYLSGESELELLVHNLGQEDDLIGSTFQLRGIATLRSIVTDYSTEDFASPGFTLEGTASLRSATQTIPAVEDYVSPGLRLGGNSTLVKLAIPYTFDNSHASTMFHISGSATLETE